MSTLPDDNPLTDHDLEQFITGCIECALWLTSDAYGNPIDVNRAQLAAETRLAMANECADFLRREDVARALTADNIVPEPNLMCRAGHDFWLTRNHHGAGFWDGDWPEPSATTLTHAAHEAGGRNLYIGDDGLVYIGPA